MKQSDELLSEKPQLKNQSGHAEIHKNSGNRSTDTGTGKGTNAGANTDTNRGADAGANRGAEAININKRSGAKYVKYRRRKKFSIGKKLMLCFTAAIFLLTVLTGSIFTVVYRNHTRSLHIDNMKKTARSIATVLTSVIEDGGVFVVGRQYVGGSAGGSIGGFGDYWGGFDDRFFHDYGGSDGNKEIVLIDSTMLIRFAKEITDADVWLIDSSLNILSTAQKTSDSENNNTSGKDPYRQNQPETSSDQSGQSGQSSQWGQSGQSDQSGQSGKSGQSEESAEPGKYNYSELPQDVQKFIAKIFEGSGYEVFGNNFSSVIGTEMMSVGMPVYSPDGNVIGAVLLHTPANDMAREINSGLLILLASLIFALIVGMILSLIMSHNIAKPLKLINSAALRLSAGDYSALTYVVRNDEIGELAHTMDEMGGKLKRAEQESEKLQQMRRDFVANISHELRTPVTVIRGSLEALCDGVVSEPERVEEYHRQLLGESIYMQRLVNDLLDLSRLQNPDFSINISDFNLYDCLSDAVRSGRRVASNKERQIDFTYDDTVYAVKGDYDRIRQMFLIIIDNAIKFTDNPENHIKVDLNKGTVSISNIGQGIKQEELPLIFERFYKSRSEQNKNGTGLGLAIAKQIASRHGIGVNVSSVQGGVTVFRFIFPEIKS